MTDIRLADDEGVELPLPVGRPGDLTAIVEDLLCSGVIMVVERYPCFDIGCKDLVFAARALANRAPSVAASLTPK